MQKTKYSPTDNDYVVSAANFLEVSEFVIFSDAYTSWYGKEAPESLIKKVFVEYLVENKVPFWVRNYARSRITEECTSSDEITEYSRIANYMMYLASIIVEYVLLASYLALR